MVIDIPPGSVTQADLEQYKPKTGIQLYRSSTHTLSIVLWRSILSIEYLSMTDVDFWGLLVLIGGQLPYWY